MLGMWSGQVASFDFKDNKIKWREWRSLENKNEGSLQGAGQRKSEPLTPMLGLREAALLMRNGESTWGIGLPSAFLDVSEYLCKLLMPKFVFYLGLFLYKVGCILYLFCLLVFFSNDCFKLEVLWSFNVLREFPHLLQQKQMTLFVLIEGVRRSYLKYISYNPYDPCLLLTYLNARN